jgi:peroxiredoxin
LILYHAYRENADSRRAYSPEIQSWALRAKTQYDLSILEHSRIRPVLLVFLRHVGCTFCREALSDLSRKRADIEATGTQIILVHMGREQAAEQILSKYKLLDIPRVSDPKLSLYEAFGLERGSMAQLFGPKVWLRGFRAGLAGNHGLGTPEGDVAQMPGVFLLFHGETLKSYRHQSAADRPDYLAMVRDLAAVPDTQSL